MVRPGRTALFGLLMFAAIPAASGFAQSVHVLQTESPVERIVPSRAGVHVQAGGIYLAVVPCAAQAGLCLEPSEAPAEPEFAPSGALPDGRVAVAASGDIRRAWYARPTARYQHGVLADAIEAGSLVVVTTDGKQSEIVLPGSMVFEDITPRIADLDGDGSNEVITIRSSRTGGAAIAVYGSAGGQIVKLAASSENGRANRWLNIAGLLPDPDGRLTVYGVRTPHIGGRLFSLDYRDGKLLETNDIATDVSNHIIGSRELGLSVIGTFGGREELILPSQDRKRLRFPLSGRADIELPGPIDKAIALVNGIILISTETGALIAVVP